MQFTQKNNSTNATTLHSLLPTRTQSKTLKTSSNSHTNCNTNPQKPSKSQLFAGLIFYHQPTPTPTTSPHLHHLCPAGCLWSIAPWSTCSATSCGALGSRLREVVCPSRYGDAGCRLAAGGVKMGDGREMGF